jgi:hypothetical protein
MPIATRPARAFATACLVVATLLTALPAPAAALEPPRPLPGYRADFVTQTDKRPMTNCLWASGAMLLDKWTNGDVVVRHQALREKSGDLVGGSTFDDLKIAYAKHGFKLKFSPDGGDRMTWPQLLARLRKGAGAIVLGDYGELPRYHGRWDYKFWKKTDDEDNHAVYIERYSSGRVWLMDPLARGDWQGEWISVWALRRFAWFSGGYVYAATTPTAKAAPFAGVKATKPKVVLSSSAVDASWTLKAPKRWKFPGADAKVAFEPAEDPLQAAAIAPPLPVKAASTEPPAKPAASVRGKTLHLVTPLPTAPGAYVGSLAVKDRRFGKSFVTAGDLAVFIPGDRRATMRLDARRAGIEAGSALKVSISVANTGTESWADARVAAASTQEVITRTTRVEARWIPLDVPGDAAPVQDEEPAAGDARSTVAEPFVVGLVPLAPGRLVLFSQSLVVPDELGLWALVVDVVDDVEGSFAALGSAPAVHVVEVVAARGFETIE